jgi:Domain of unknown function (DUF4192)
MTESIADLPAASLRGPADLIELIPYLLGFHPTDSVVVVELRQGRSRVGSILRADLAGAAAGEEFASCLAARFAAGSADGALVAVYGSAGVPPGHQGAAVVEQLGAALRAVGVPLCDALAVGGGRWRSYFCCDPRCCPAAGRPLAARPSSAAAAAAAVAGLVALPDRQALARTLAPATAGVTASMAKALERAEAALVLVAERREGMPAWRAATRERFRRAVRRARGASQLDGPGPGWLTDQDVARLLVGLADIGGRDACWRDLDLRCSPEGFAVCWQLARRSVPPYRAAPLFLLGWAAWRRGDGALARIAALEALDAEPGYDAARLLLVVLDHGIDPNGLPKLAIRPGRPPGRRRRRSR